MKIYSYRVAGKNETVETGEIEGQTETEVADKLAKEGKKVLSIQEKLSPQGGVIGAGSASFLDRFRKVSLSDKIFLFKNLSTMIEAGLPLVESVELLEENVKSGKLKDILKHLRSEVESGREMSYVLAQYPKVFSNGEVSMVKAGEVSGNLHVSFNGLYEDADADKRLRKDIKGAMMYPAIIFSIMTIISLALFIFVIPQLTNFFVQSNIEVPLITQIIISVSGFLKRYYIYLFLGIVGVIVGVNALLASSKDVQRFRDIVLLKIPWFNRQYKYFYVHRIARMMSMLLRNGVSIVEALEIAESSLANVKYRETITQSSEEVKRGGKLSESFAKHEKLYPGFVPRMLTVGDRTGKTDESFENISTYYEDELRDTLSNLSSIIEPILMVILGIGVAFIAISVLIPMYRIVSGVNQL